MSILEKLFMTPFPVNEEHAKVTGGILKADQKAKQEKKLKEVSEIESSANPWDLKIRGKRPPRKIRAVLDAALLPEKGTVKEYGAIFNPNAMPKNAEELANWKPTTRAEAQIKKNMANSKKSLFNFSYASCVSRVVLHPDDAMTVFQSLVDRGLIIKRESHSLSPLYGWNFYDCLEFPPGKQVSKPSKFAIRYAKECALVYDFICKNAPTFKKDIILSLGITHSILEQVIRHLNAFFLIAFKYGRWNGYYPLPLEFHQRNRHLLRGTPDELSEFYSFCSTHQRLAALRP